MMKTVLITGSTSGIGLQLTLDYFNAGWTVIACGRKLENLTELLNDERFIPCQFDITHKADCDHALSSIPTPDLVILNAGSCEYVDDPVHLDTELFKRMFDVNVQGVIHSLSAITPRLKSGSRIAIVSSSVTILPLPRSEAYGATKAALDYLTKTLAIDLKPSGIDVSLIQPGFVDTPLTQVNDFPMPGIVSVSDASQIIRQGLEKGKSIIRFPFLFITIMKTLSFLPHALWVTVAQRLVRNA